MAVDMAKDKAMYVVQDKAMDTTGRAKDWTMDTAGSAKDWTMGNTTGSTGGRAMDTTSDTKDWTGEGNNNKHDMMTEATESTNQNSAEMPK